jgi:hypothetical protein
VRRFCQPRGIEELLFYYWRKRVREQRQPMRFGALAASLGSSLFVLRRFDSQEQLIPLMMFSRRAGPPAWEAPIQQTDVRDQIHLHPSPVRKWAAADTADLIPKKLNRTIVNPIIVGFDDSRLLLINQLN